MKLVLNLLPRLLEISLKSLRVGVLALLLVVSTGLMGAAKLPPADAAYVRQVLRLKGDASQGAAIFQMNCAVCHGIQANGNVGPSLRDVSTRKSPQGLIEQVISGQTPPMPQFQPSEQAMADLLSYLQAL